jgi:Na+-transporting methylmalonyl-CoA/oxaloacetate decarboxylase gamma subunit
MKKIMMIVLLLGLTLSYASEEVQIDSKATFKEVSFQVDIPLKKLANLLSREIEPEQIVAESGVTVAEIREAIEKFEQIEDSYNWSIVLIGMVVVFLSLILIGILIGLLQQLNKWDEIKERQNKRVSKGKKSKIKKITAVDGNLSNDAIVAVISAIYLHELEVEERNKLNLTWKRAPLSMWRSANKVSFPNKTFFKVRRKF